MKMKRLIISLACLSIIFINATYSKIVDFKWKLNKNFVLNAYKKEFDSLVGTARYTPESALKHTLKQDNVKVLVINKKLAGFIAYNKRHAIIDGVYVHPQFRGKGHLNTLLRFTEQRLGKKGAKKIEMGVYHYNQRALKAFKKAGYTYQGGWATQKHNHLITLTKKIK
jgi:ribosomal protein S18 acetylase RimI-like enzyme